MEDVHALMDKVGCRQASLVSRDSNNVAHKIAHEPDCISILHTSEHISKALERDVIEHQARFLFE